MMLAELLAQFLDSTKAMPRPVLQLYERYDRGKCSPQVEDLETTLLLVCKKFKTLFFVVDGLNEWEDARHWNSLLVLVKSLKTTSARLFVTSRSNWEGISNILDHHRFIITAHEKDIRRYLTLTMQQDNNFAKLVDGSLQSKIIRKITQSPQSVEYISISDRIAQVSMSGITNPISYASYNPSRYRARTHPHASGYKQDV